MKVAKSAWEPFKGGEGMAALARGPWSLPIFPNATKQYLSNRCPMSLWKNLSMDWVWPCRNLKILRSQEGRCARQCTPQSPS